MSKLLPINDNITIKRLQPLRRGMIHIPEEKLQKEFYGIIQEVGNKVRDTFLQKDLIVFLTSTSKHTCKYGDLYVIKEHDILAIKKDGIIRAFGDRVLIKRLNQETVSPGGIIIPDCHDSADQSLEGILISRGVKNGQVIDIPIHGGETVRIEKWNQYIVELDVDGEYYLSVRVRDICYAKHN